ncbi:MAG TPA: ABC transporter substrate-binding protein [Candidatus Sulfotelmatobacter sp.]|nr:ABC transporter substrate-binding protein [Candidatus Sulfotelmatobacter sp.]
MHLPIRRLLALLATVLLAACTSGPGTASPTPSGPTPTATSVASATASPTPSATPSGAPTPLVVGLGYIPSVQFAQFYLAQEQGYYRAAGLDVTFQNKNDPDLITLVGQGSVDVGVADGTSVIPAVSQGIPIQYVATLYGSFPNVVFAKASSNIAAVTDLRGKKIGTPGRYGSSWIMLEALLASANMTASDVQVVLYPDYGQAVAVQQGAVDAATGFTNNEPVQLQLNGTPTTELHVDQATPLPGPGLIVSTATLAAKHDALKAFVAATIRAMNDIVADPQVGLTASIAAQPTLAGSDATQLAILQATITTWQSPYTQAHGLGAIDRSAWTQSIDFMTTLPEKPVAGPVTVDQVVNEGLLP